MTDPSQANQTKWLVATLESTEQTSDNLKSLVFRLPEPRPFQSGQHYDIRLTATNGYQTERSYSIASEPSDPLRVEFGVQLLSDGEVSPFLWQMSLGEKIEVRGPIGGHFVWNTRMPGPLILIGGGSGVVPLVSMLRHHVQVAEKDGVEAERPVVLLASMRTIEHLPYREELTKIKDRFPATKIMVTLTDKQPEGWTGYSRRIDEQMIADVCEKYRSQMPLIYICGPTTFVEAVSKILAASGYNIHNIKTERFG